MKKFSFKIHNYLPVNHPPMAYESKERLERDLRREVYACYLAQRGQEAAKRAWSNVHITVTEAA